MIINSEQFNAAYSKLPFPIREFLAGDELPKVTQSIGQTHGLHTDTIGAVERETTNMLLGFLNPTQFVGELKSIGVPQESVGAIVEELNTKVFIPLREKMKNAPPEEPRVPDEDDEPTQAVGIPVTTRSAPPVSTAAPIPQAPISPAVSSPVPPPPPLAYVPAPITPAPLTYAAPVSAPAVPVAPPPIPVAAAPIPVPSSLPAQPMPPIQPPSIPQVQQHVPMTNATQFMAPRMTAAASQGAPITLPGAMSAPHARTMKEDMEMAKTAGERPAPLSAPASNAPVYAPAPTPVAPAPFVPPAVPQTPPASIVSPLPPAAIPSMPSMPPSSFTPAPVTPSAPPAPQPQKNRDALHDVLKQYGIDPYREPVE